MFSFFLDPLLMTLLPVLFFWKLGDCLTSCLFALSLSSSMLELLEQTSSPVSRISHPLLRIFVICYCCLSLSAIERNYMKNARILYWKKKEKKNQARQITDGKKKSNEDRNVETKKKPKKNQKSYFVDAKRNPVSFFLSSTRKNWKLINYKPLLPLFLFFPFFYPFSSSLLWNPFSKQQRQ